MIINAWLEHVQSLMIIIIVLFVIYMVAKIISKVQSQKSAQARVLQEIHLALKPKERKLIEVEITSRDLIIKARNLIEQSEVYGLQLEQCIRDIKAIEDKIEETRNPLPELTHSNELDLSDPTIKDLIDQSLRLQERKVKLDEKLIRIHNTLDGIAREELKRKNA
jgi:hypothetical protein